MKVDDVTIRYSCKRVKASLFKMAAGDRFQVPIYTFTLFMSQRERPTIAAAKQVIACDKLITMLKLKLNTCIFG